MNHPTSKPAAGAALPTFEARNVDGTGMLAVGGKRDRWLLLVIYRGKHCGRCKTYLGTLEAMQADWQAAGFDILAVSADSREKATADVADQGWSFPVACELSEADMRALGLYISDPLTPDEADRRFAEPGVFCLRPDGSVQIVAISNGPAARPDLAALLDGMKFTIEHDKPARGQVI